jgi:hypothetical protein
LILSAFTTSEFCLANRRLCAFVVLSQAPIIENW